MSDLTKDYRRVNRELVDEFAQFMAVGNYSASYQYFAKVALNKFVQFLGTDDVTAADSRLVRTYFSHVRADGGSAHKTYHYRSVLRRFYRRLMVFGVVRSNPAQNVPIPKLPKRIGRHLENAEAMRLIEATADPFERAVCELFYATGLRTGEAARLRLEQIDFTAGSIRIIQGKGRKDRRLFFGAKCSEALQAHLAGRREGFLFTNSRGGPIQQDKIRKAIAAAAARAGLGRVTPLTLRHTFATCMLNAGVDIRYVGELLGHARLSTTAIYTHAAIADLSRTLDKFHPHGGDK